MTFFKQLFAFFTIILIITLFMPSCKKSTDTNDDGGPTNQSFRDKAVCSGVDPTYTADLKPIFDSKCATAGCHDSKTRSHNLDLSSYASIKGSFDVHAFICAISWEATCSKMPQGGTKLSDADINKITCWSKNGYTQ